MEPTVGAKNSAGTAHKTEEAGLFSPFQLKELRYRQVKQIFQRYTASRESHVGQEHGLLPSHQTSWHFPLCVMFL